MWGETKLGGPSVHMKPRVCITAQVTLCTWEKHGLKLVLSPWRRHWEDQGWAMEAALAMSPIPCLFWRQHSRSKQALLAYHWWKTSPEHGSADTERVEKCLPQPTPPEVGAGTCKSCRQVSEMFPWQEKQPESGPSLALYPTHCHLHPQSRS